MSFQEKFTAAEWILLRNTPILAASAIMTAGETGLTQSMLEVYSMTNSLTHPEGFGELSAEISSALKTDSNVEQIHITNPAEVKPKAIEACRQVVALLEVKTGLQEATDYKKWVLFVACNVAKAAKEGGFLGIGGKRVSDPEQLILNELAQTLGFDHTILSQFLS